MERRVVRMREAGDSVETVARKFRKSPDFIERVLRMIEIPRSGEARRRQPTPLQNVVLALRAKGESHESIARRFRKSDRFIRQVEGHARFQQGIDLLSAAAHDARLSEGSGENRP